MGRTSLPRIVAICSDPGAGNAVGPVIEALRTEGRVTIHALAYRETCRLWAKRHLTFDKVAEGIPQSALDNILSNPKASLLLTGTSYNSIDLEKQFIAAAKERGLPSLAVLDFWSHYALRFSDGEGRLAFMPDRIAIMDEQARNEMATEGFDAGRLVITGQPAFDNLVLWRAKYTPARREAIRKFLNVGPGELLVLFVSQPLSLLYGTDPANPLYLGYDEQTVLRALVIALEKIAEQHQQEIVLLIRPHPREHVESFEKVRSHTVRVILSRNSESRELLMAADLVAGMNTILLVDACYLGCITVSLQPGLRLPDVLPTNRLGLSRLVYREEEIKPVLEEMLLSEETRLAARSRLADPQLDNHATGRVVKLVYQMIGLEQGKIGVSHGESGN